MEYDLEIGLLSKIVNLSCKSGLPHLGMCQFEHFLSPVLTARQRVEHYDGVAILAYDWPAVHEWFKPGDYDKSQTSQILPTVREVDT